MPLNLCLLPPVPKQHVGGRIAHFYQNWLNITSNPWVLETVLGHSIEFLESSYQSYLPTTHVTTDEKELTDQDVLAPQQKHAIHRVPESNSHDRAQFISLLFTVPKKGGGHRPVVNLKGLNHFVEYQHFKMEGVSMLKDLLKPNDFLTKIDLKDAYLTVPVWIHHRKFLRFLWRDTVWEFACLPFGLASAL